MKRLLATTLLAALASTAATAQGARWSAEDEAGVVRAAKDYMEGAATADADRVTRGVHAELNKVIVATLPQTGGQVLSYNTASTLVEAVRGFGDRLADIDKTVDVTVFDIAHDLAVARVVGAVWYDFLQLAKINDEWKIVNVLWAQNRPDPENQQQNPPADAEAVEQTALDYIEGAFSGDGIRMERALHPELNKVRLVTHPQTGVKFLQKMGVSMLVEGTRAGLGTLDDDQRNIAVEVYDVSHDIALAKVTSAMYIDYLQVAKFNSEWKIINVLWVPNPGTPSPAR